MNRKQRSPLVSLLGILALAAILSAALYVLKTEEYKDWVSTEGTLTRMEETYRTGGRHHVGGGSRYILYYTYGVDGKEYDGRDSFSGNLPEEHFIGETITVWYDPDACSKSMLDQPGPGLWPTVPFIFAVPIALFVLGGAGRRGRTLR